MSHHAPSRPDPRRRILIASFLHFDVSFLCWVMVGALGVFISADLHLSAAQKGLLVAVPVLSASAARIAVGAVADRWSMKGAGFITIACAGAGLVLASTVARSYSALLGTGLLLGVSGASFAVALPLASRWFPPERQGLALGVAGAGNSGTVLATFVAPRIAVHIGGQATMALALLPLGTMAVAWALLAVDPADRPVRTRLGDVLAAPDLWMLALVYGVTFGGFVGLTSFMPILLSGEYRVNAVDAGMMTAAAAFLGSALRPVGGLASDRWNGRTVALAVLVAAGACALLVGTHVSAGVTVATLLVMLSALGCGNGAVFQMAPQRFPREIAVVTGLIGAAGGLGGFLLPTLLGALKDATGGYLAGFSVFALAAAAALTVVAVAGRRWRRTWLSRESRTGKPPATAPAEAAA